MYGYEFSYAKGGRLPCGDWLGVASVAKIILRVWGSRGTPLRLSPATCHCRANEAPLALLHRDGASRSGIFCAASFLCEQIQSEGMVDVSQAVRMLKRRRRQFIKNVVGANFKSSWDGNTKTRAIS